MAMDRKVSFRGHLFLELLYARIFKLDDCTADSANKVIVMLIATADLIPCLSIPKIALLCNTAFLEELEGSIDSGISNIGVVTSKP